MFINQCNMNFICFVGLILVVFETSAQTTNCFEVQKNRRVKCAKPSVKIFGVSLAVCQAACKDAGNCRMFDYNMDAKNCFTFDKLLVDLPTEVEIQRDQHHSEIATCIRRGPHRGADSDFEHHKLKTHCLSDARRPASEEAVPDPTVRLNRKVTSPKRRISITKATTTTLAPITRRMRRTTTTTATTTTTTRPTTTTVNVIRPNHIFVGGRTIRNCSSHTKSTGKRRDDQPLRPILLWYPSSKFVLKLRRNGRRRPSTKGDHVTQTTSPQCQAQCLENRWNNCVWAEYNLTSWECNLRAWVKPNSRTLDWVPALQFDHYEKRCVSSQAAAACPGPHRIEIQWTYRDFSHARHRMHVNEVNFCVELCAELKARGEFDCKSGVFLGNVEGDEDNCFLSDRTLTDAAYHLLDGLHTGFAMKCTN